jgi:hypothetical protein
MMIKLWIKIKRKRKNKPKRKSRKEINKKTKVTRTNLAHHRNTKKKLRSKRKRKNSDLSLIALITVNGKRKTDFKKVIRYLLSLEAIRISKEPLNKEAGFIILTRQVPSLTSNSPFRVGKLIMPIFTTTNL